jgi:hypothetical protein
VTLARGGIDLSCKMLAHYRMLRLLRIGRWQSAKATAKPTTLPPTCSAIQSSA